YPLGYEWRYREQRSRLAWMGLGGLLPTLALLFACQRIGLPAAWAQVANLTGWALVIADLWIVSYPSVNSNGRLLWDGNRVLWGLLVLLTLGWLAAQAVVTNSMLRRV